MTSDNSTADSISRALFFLFFCLRVLEVDRESVTAPRNLSEPGEKKKKKEHRKKTEPNTHTHTQTSSAIEKKQKKKQRPNKDPADLPAMATKPNGPFRRKKRKRKKKQKTKKKSVLAGAICASFVSLIL